MPSLEDVANQINSTLSDISANTHQTSVVAGQIKADTAAANVKLDTIQQTLATGFNQVELGLYSIAEAQKATNSLLAENNEENKTMICWLSTIATLLCDILRIEQAELKVDRNSSESITRLRKVFELVHARETVEVERTDTLQAEIDKCCGPKPEEPRPCFEPCQLHEVPPYQPKGQDWTPPKQQQPK